MVSKISLAHSIHTNINIAITANIKHGEKDIDDKFMHYRLDPSVCLPPAQMKNHDHAISTYRARVAHLSALAIMIPSILIQGDTERGVGFCTDSASIPLESITALAGLAQHVINWLCDSEIPAMRNVVNDQLANEKPEYFHMLDKVQVKTLFENFKQYKP